MQIQKTKRTQILVLQDEYDGKLWFCDQDSTISKHISDTDIVGTYDAAAVFDDVVDATTAAIKEREASLSRKRMSKSERDEIFKRAGGKCVYCGCRLIRDPDLFIERARSRIFTVAKWKVAMRQVVLCAFQIDHVIPKSAGGRTTLENCVACCKSCNSKKGNGPPLERSSGRPSASEPA
jgi:hypothetical protein